MRASLASADYRVGTTVRARLCQCCLRWVAYGYGFYGWGTTAGNCQFALAPAGASRYASTLASRGEALDEGLIVVTASTVYSTNAGAGRSRRCALASMLLAALAFAPGCRLSANGHNIDGVQNYQLGNYQAAIQNFQQALSRDPNNADAYYNLAAVYHELGRKNSDKAMLGQAEGLYHQCLDRSEDHVDCHRGLAALLVQTNRTESAFTLLQRWAASRPKLADPQIELARLYDEFGDRQAAAKHLTDALDVNPRSARAWTALASLREQQGQLAQALANYQQAYRLNGNEPGVAYRMAALQRRMSVTPGSSGQAGTRMVNTPRQKVR